LPIVILGGGKEEERKEREPIPKGFSKRHNILGTKKGKGPDTGSPGYNGSSPKQFLGILKPGENPFGKVSSEFFLKLFYRSFSIG
jgi:hypothetical protein